MSVWLAGWLVSSFLSRCPYRQCRLDPACWLAFLLIIAQQQAERSPLCSCVRTLEWRSTHLAIPDGAGAENCLTVGSDCDYPVDGTEGGLNSYPGAGAVESAGTSYLHRHTVRICVYMYLYSLHEGRKAPDAGWGIRFCWVGPAYRIRSNSLQRPTAAVGSYRALGKAINPGRCE